MTRPGLIGPRRIVGTLATVLFLCAHSSGAHAQSNLIQNPGFENNPPPNFGNNIGWSIAPWVVGGGSAPNVVKVDGPGGNNYGASGPESDATGPGSGIEQHYLDIANGENEFYQSFTVPECQTAPAGTDAMVTFGGYFSGRDNAGGTAAISLLQGVGFGGSVIQTVTANVPSGASQTDPWILVGSTLSLARGSTFSYVVNMPNPINFDDAYLTIEDDACGGSITIQKSVDWLYTFDFTTSGAGLSNFSLTPANNSSAATTFNNLSPGSFTVTETAVPGYDLIGLSCTGDTDGGNVIDLANGVVTIDLDAGENQTCTFTNVESHDPVDGAQCLEPEAKVQCNPDGTVTVTVTAAAPTGFSGTTIEAISMTPGVTVSPTQQTLAPGQTQTQWTLTGGQPGQTVTLMVNQVDPGGGSKPGVDLCCSGEVKIVIPECPKLPVDVAIEKEVTKPEYNEATGLWTFQYTLTVSNAGNPFTPLNGNIQITDPVPPGLTFVSAAGTNWNCPAGQFPLTAGALSCSYNFGFGPWATNIPLSPLVITVTTEKPGSYENCADIALAGGLGLQETTLQNNQSCTKIEISKPGTLTIEKTGPEQCLPTQDCDFTITITAVGGPFDGDIIFYETTSPNPVTIVSVNPNICSGVPPTSPLICGTHVTLNAGPNW